MADFSIDLTPLQKAIARLEEGLERFSLNADDDQLRDGLIQRFEFTSEISHKMLKRFLESTSPTPGEVDSMTFQDLIRTGNERGLLKGDWLQWKVYRDMRARSTHAYADAVAISLIEEIPAFLEEAKTLEERLRGELK